MIEKCTFCEGSEPLRKRLPFGNKRGRVLIVLSFSQKYTQEQQDVMAGLYPNALFMWRISCENPSDYADAEIGCGIFVRWKVDNFDVVAVPKEHVRELFGEIATEQMVALESGKVVIPYSNIKDLQAELQRVDALK